MGNFSSWKQGLQKHGVKKEASQVDQNQQAIVKKNYCLQVKEYLLKREWKHQGEALLCRIGATLPVPTILRDGKKANLPKLLETSDIGFEVNISTGRVTLKGLEKAKKETKSNLNLPSTSAQSHPPPPPEIK